MDNTILIYRYHEPNHWQPVARVLVEDSKLVYLEDHAGFQHFLGDIADEKFVKRINSLNSNGRYKVVLESELHNHPEHVPVLDTGPAEADAKYLINGGEFQNTPIEIHGNNILLNGKHLTDLEANQITEGLHAGKYHLEQIHG